MDERAVVIDNGSGLVKAGFAGEAGPAVVFPSIVGRKKKSVTVLHGGFVQDTYVGEDAQAHRAILDLKYVLQHGVVEDWQDMRTLWEHTFDNELKVDAADQPVMLTEAPLNPKSNREKMAEEMFEYFNVPALSIQIQAVLSLFSTGRKTGLVIDSGDGVTHTIPVYNSTMVKYAIGRVDIAGHNITNNLSKLLTERGYSYLQDDTGLEIVRDIKEKLSYLALDYDTARTQYKSDKEAVDKQYTLPDGKVITIGDERFRAPEILFQPEMLGKQARDAVHQLVIQSVLDSATDTRTDLLNNVVLSGGTTMITGFKERLQKELDAALPSVLGTTAKAKVIATNERKWGVWIGGSILASLATFQEKWVTKEMYDEDPDMIHKE